MQNLKQACYGRLAAVAPDNPEKYLCLRSGLLSFQDEAYSRFKEDPLSEEAASFDRYTPPYVEPLPCLRFFLEDTGLNLSFRIPQLSMYFPESGYPLCESSKTRQYKSAGCWPSKLRRFFVTIPIVNIVRGLYGMDVLDHQLTVYKAFMPPFEPADILSPMNPLRKRYGSNLEGCFPFITDVNALTCLATKGLLPEPPAPEGEDVSNWFNSLIYNTWGSELAMRDRAELRNFFVSKALDRDEFDAYLPYWAFLYPNKYTASWKSYGATGTAPDEVEEAQGYIRFTPNKHNEDVFYGENKVWRTYYGLKKSQPFLGTRTPLDPHSGVNPFISYVDRNAQGFYVKYKNYPHISRSTLLHLANIRAFIDHRGVRNHNPFAFKAPRYSRRGETQRLPSQLLKALSEVGRIRDKYEEKSVVVTVPGEYCRKCGGDLKLLELLAEQQPDFEKVVCIPCGSKYLVNMAHNFLAGDKKWIYFKDYPLVDVAPMAGKSTLTTA